MNAGVMVMNVAKLHDDYPAFREFITSGDTLYYELFKKGLYDQMAYRTHYASQWDELPLEYNWRPHWGFNDRAVIVHFHGPKIWHARNLMEGRTASIREGAINLFRRDPDAYKRYLAYVDKYAPRQLT